MRFMATIAAEPGTISILHVHSKPSEFFHSVPVVCLSTQLEWQLRGACPAHKKKDLDKLFKKLNGDEAKIMQKIQEWWDEPAPTREEESWEAVNKKVVKRKPAGDRRDRGRGGGRDAARSNQDEKCRNFIGVVVVVVVLWKK